MHLLMSPIVWFAALEPSDQVALVILGAGAIVCSLLVRGSRYGVALGVWTGAILSAAVPVLDLHGHTHWHGVAWVPFKSPPVSVPDVLANLVLYVPFGYLSRSNRLGRTKTAALALALSLFSEFSQVFSHTRIPSGTDVVCNTIGSLIGFGLAAWITPSAMKSEIPGFFIYRSRPPQSAVDAGPRPPS